MNRRWDLSYPRRNDNAEFDKWPGHIATVTVQQMIKEKIIKNRNQIFQTPEQLAEQLFRLSMGEEVIIDDQEVQELWFESNRLRINLLEPNSPNQEILKKSLENALEARQWRARAIFLDSDSKINTC